MRLNYLILLLACLPIFVSADFGYNVFNASADCAMDGTGGGGRNGFVLGNIGYGGCWINDTNTGIIFTPCNPSNTYKYAKTWADSSVLINPIFQGQSVVNDDSWRCYDWIGVDTNVIETTTGEIKTGRVCDPDNVSTFKGGQLKYNLDCAFAGGALIHNTTSSCSGVIDCSNYTDLGYFGCEGVYGSACWFDINPLSWGCKNRGASSCSQLTEYECSLFGAPPKGSCVWSGSSPVSVDCNSSDLNASSPQARLHCAPIDCEPLMASSILSSLPNPAGASTRDYYCRDFQVYLKPMSVTRQVKDDNRGGKWNEQTNEFYFTDVNPGLYTLAYDQFNSSWVSVDESYYFGLITINKATMLLTPTNINYELSAMCINGNDSSNKPYTMNTFLMSNFSAASQEAKMIGDWFPLHVEMPPNTPIYNQTGLGAMLGNMGSQASIWWDTSTATTADQNICINRANWWTMQAETPALFIKNPGKALQNMIPNQLKDMINLLAFIIDLALCGVIIWFVMRVIKAFLELRLYLYQRKIFLVLTPLIAYITWSLASLIAFKIILENELAFKSTMIFAGIHSLFGVGTNNIIETAIVGAASVVLGMLPAYFYKVALILASVLILMTMLVLLYDAWFVYLKPLAYPKYKMNQ